MMQDKLIPYSTSLKHNMDIEHENWKFGNNPYGEAPFLLSPQTNISTRLVGTFKEWWVSRGYDDRLEPTSSVSEKCPVTPCIYGLETGGVGKLTLKVDIFQEEEFLQQFVNDAYACSVKDRKNYVSYKHIASAVSKCKRFDFLSDFVPERVSAEKALAERSAKT
ncbi:hypothetical protein CK203_074215 [Vitis vinifera]|uniref:Uncharacterized protein n=1 Tax=Vitis vinifera TaxID=29760 RepID=A0A438DTG6_VITVI|nr:hypothetical protein CK203_074215 [Vitis vinifera]